MHSLLHILCQILTDDCLVEAVFLWILQTLRYEYQLFHEPFKRFGLSFL
jgi:hypothetical protein